MFMDFNEISYTVLNITYYNTYYDTRTLPCVLSVTCNVMTLEFVEYPMLPLTVDAFTLQPFCYGRPAAYRLAFRYLE